MKEMSNLQKKIHQLGAPYKKSTAYKVFGNVNRENSKVSSFWKAKVDYVAKYKNAKMIKEKNKL